MATPALDRLDLSAHRTLANLSSAELVERAIAAGEGTLASNGALRRPFPAGWRPVLHARPTGEDGEE